MTNSRARKGNRETPLAERRYATWNPQTRRYEAPGEPCDLYKVPPGGGYYCYHCGHEWRKHNQEARSDLSPSS